LLEGRSVYEGYVGRMGRSLRVVGMSERDNAEDLGSTLKALHLFQTLRTILALFSSFVRRWVLKPANRFGEGLEFLGVEPSENQGNHTVDYPCRQVK